jgi:hypothetical protein
MGETCSTNGELITPYKMSVGRLKATCHFRNIHVDQRLILKLILDKWGVRSWKEFNYLWIGSNNNISLT